jgi:hypothetical protein
MAIVWAINQKIVRLLAKCPGQSLELKLYIGANRSIILTDISIGLIEELLVAMKLVL